MPTRNPLKAFFITFPQWCDDIDTVKEFPSTLPVDVEYLMIAREHHADGNPHFHMALKLSAGLSKARLLKYLICCYPDDYKRIDVQPLKSWKDTFIYLTKEDEAPYEYGERPLVCNNLAKTKKPWMNNGEFLYESQRLFDNALHDARDTLERITDERLAVIRQRLETANQEDSIWLQRWLSEELQKRERAEDFVNFTTIEDFRTKAWADNLIRLHY